MITQSDIIFEDFSLKVNPELEEINEGFFDKLSGSSSSKLSEEERREKTIQIIRNVYNSNYKGKTKYLNKQIGIDQQTPYAPILDLYIVDLADAAGGLLDSKTKSLISQFVKDLDNEFSKCEGLNSKVERFDSFTYKIMVKF